MTDRMTERVTRAMAARATHDTAGQEFAAAATGSGSGGAPEFGRSSVQGSGTTPAAAGSNALAMSQLYHHWVEIKNSLQGLKGHELEEEYKELMTAEIIDNMSPIQRKELLETLARSEQFRSDFVTYGRSIGQQGRTASAQTAQTEPASAQGSHVGALANTAGKMPDALSKLLHKAPLFTGDYNDDAEETLMFYQNACRVVQAPREAQVECIFLVLGGEALRIWTTAMKATDYISPTEVFTVLKNRLFGLAGEQLGMSEFRALRFDDSIGGSTLEAFNALIAKAQKLQRRLPKGMQAEEVLVSTLQGAVRGQPWAFNVLNDPPNSLQHFVQRCRLGIVNMPADEPTNNTFFATNKYSKRKNRKGRDGKTLRCLKCKSMYHLFRECPRADEADDIRFTEMFATGEAEDEEAGSGKASDEEEEHVRFVEELPADDEVHEVDVFYLNNKPVLQAVCVHTGYTRAVFLKDKSNKTVWDAFIATWVCTTSGLPHELRVDQGSEFIGMGFTSTAQSHGISVVPIGVEAHWQLGRGEQVHGPLRRVHSRLSAEPGSDALSDSLLLELCVKVLNDTMNPSGFIPTLLVFGVTPRTILGTDMMASLDQRARMHVMRTIRTEYESLVAMERLHRALSGKYPMEVAMKPGDLVKVYRFKRKLWEGPMTLVSIEYDRNIAVVRDHKNSTQMTLSVAVVRPFRERTSGLATPDLYYLNDESDTVFEAAKASELQGLIARNVFEDVSHLPSNANLLRTKWVLTVKADGSPKARLTILGHVDRDKAEQVPEAPTLQFVTMRAILALARHRRLQLWTQDVKQAFLQSENLSRAIYVLPPAEYNRKGDMKYWKLVKPLYGLVDAPTYWSKTVLNDLQERNLVQGTDPCAFITSEAELLGIYVDDIIAGGGNHLSDVLKTFENRFDVKEREFLVDDGPPLRFAGQSMRLVRGMLEIDQQAFLKVLLDQDTKVNSYKELQTIRGKWAWLSALTSPLTTYITGQLMQVTESTFDRDKTNHLISMARNVVGLDTKLLVPNLSTKLALRVYSDAAFGNNEDLSSQVGYCVILCDNNGTGVPLLWTSKKTRRIVRSVLGAEVLALSDALDAGLYVKALLHSLKQQVELHLFTDSKCIFDSVTTSRVTTEKRLALDLAVIREAFQRQEIARICWIRGEDNLADALTKVKSNKSLARFLQTGKVLDHVEQEVKQGV
ncbi:Copia protein [Porphyridium purpureum]|uniref:Copia protein n=1 Tax=Porphyridium purpureum TaxID=35688 RepID=A0A5J4YKT1_PORPP|nr:Copia protein [Porphyridium purpureum]|eukprot:POR0102..scf249_10